MSEMIERIKRAIERVRHDPSIVGSSEEIARAMIEAMRDPTAEMIKDGDGAVELSPSDLDGSWCYRYDDGDAKKVWQKMCETMLRD